MTKCMNVTTGNLRYVRYVLYGRVRGTPYVSTYVRGAVSSPLEISNLSAGAFSKKGKYK